MLKAVLLVVLISVPVVAKKSLVLHEPLPASVLSAKSLYIQNDSGSADMADKAYTQLKEWGRFQIVDSKEKADLVLVLNESRETRQHDSVDSVSLHNSATGAWTTGTVPSTATRTWTFTEVRLLDRAGEVAWSDRKVQSRKYSACMELIKELQARMAESH